MTPSRSDAGELDDLLSALCEDDLSADQAARLSEILRQDRRARQRYLQYLDLHGALHWDGVNHASLDSELSEDARRGLDDAMVLPALRLSDEPEAPLEQEVPSYPARQPLLPVKPWYLRPAVRWTAAAASLLLVIGVTLLVLRDDEEPGRRRRSGPLVVSPSTRPVSTVATVATLTAEVGARWNDSASAAPVGTALAAGRSLDLRAGFVELSFAEGATVVVEGPARVTLLGSADVSLNVGKLVAKVPGGGFVVRTSAGTVTDLGTEFGVHAARDGSTSVDVFAGSVQAAPVRKAPGGSTTAPSPKVLTAGQAAKVTTGGQVALDPQGATPQRFVRSLSGPTRPTVLDVVDLIAGGDGTSRRRGYAIDPRDGAAGRLQNVGAIAGDGRYHPVPSLPVVDGCFVPSAQGGPMQVDSAGHQFEFPASTNGRTFNLIWLGGRVPGAPGMPATDRPMSSILGGVDYTAGDRSGLALHAGKGLTIDLNEVRRLYPGRSLVRFSCVAGNTWTPTPADKQDATVLADLFVLVDGKPAFEKRRFPHSTAPFQVDLAINPADRFLTIGVTDGGDGIASDWIMLGDPRLQLSDRAQ